MKTCKNCGITLMQAAEKGRYFRRISPKGELFEGVCAPACDHENRDSNAAVIAAIEASNEALTKLGEDKQ